MANGSRQHVDDRANLATINPAFLTHQVNKLAMSSQSEMANLSREELIRLVDHIMSVSGCIVDLDALLNQFEENVDHPNASELIFNPRCGRRMTAEEIVDMALDYRAK